MAHNYDDLHPTDELDDDELRRLVREQLNQTDGLDAAEIIVTASAGSARLTGRVGTDEERRIADHVLTDVLGIERVTNDLLIDQNFRATNPEASDEPSEDSDTEASRLDVEVPLSGESTFLADAVIVKPDDATDVQSAMEDGTPWSPPSGPTPEGPEEMGGRP